MKFNLPEGLINTIEQMTEEMFVVIDLSQTDLNEAVEEAGDAEYFAEAAGALKGLPTHMIKAVVNNHAAGENSAVKDSGRVGSMSVFRKHIDDNLKAGNSVTVMKNGKPHVLIHSRNNYGARPEYGIKNDTGDEVTKERNLIRGTGKWNSRLKRHVPAEYHTYDNPSFTKGDAINRAVFKTHDGEEQSKEFFKNHDIRVHAIGADTNRIKVHKGRVDNRPKMQTNYVKAKPGEEQPYMRDKKRTSETPAGDMSKITDTAAMKVARKTLGQKDSPAETAKKLHADIAKHIESGDSRAAKDAIEKLHNHVRNSGLSHEDYDTESYASALKELKSSWSKEWARKRIADIKAKAGK